MVHDRIVLCMKWGTLFSADYVNVLHSACRHYLKTPFRFVCLTDNNADLSEGIEVLPIPEIGCTPEMWHHGAWPKLSVFAPEIGSMRSGRVLFIDLDTVVCSDMEPFFTYPAPFVGIDTSDNWRPGRVPGGPGALLGTGVFAFNLGTQVQILRRFQADPSAAFRKAKLEQVWAQEHVDSLEYWPQDWVISFKRWLRQPIGLDLFLPPKEPPAQTKMVAFHGNPRPAALLMPGRNRWDKLPRFGRGQVAWMASYWTQHGGALPGHPSRL